MARGYEAFKDVRKSDLGEKVLIVAHGGLLTAALKALLSIPADKNPLSMLNCAVTKINWADLDNPKMAAFNLDEHLKSVNSGRKVHSGDL